MDANRILLLHLNKLLYMSKYDSTWKNRKKHTLLIFDMTKFCKKKNIYMILFLILSAGKSHEGEFFELIWVRNKTICDVRYVLKFDDRFFRIEFSQMYNNSC